VLCLLPAVLVSTRPRFAPRDLAPIALLGIAQFGILIALLNHGLRFIPSRARGADLRHRAAADHAAGRRARP